MSDRDPPAGPRGPEPDRPATPALARGAAVLGVAPGAPPATARVAFFRALADSGFAPAEESVAAVNALVGMRVPLTPEALETVGADDVEAFAAGYWALPPADRRARWAVLSGRYPHGDAARRLRQFKAGLDLPVVPHADPGAAEIAALVRELFLLPAPERTVRRAWWLIARADRIKELAASAQQVLKDDPLTANLDPRLFFTWFTLEQFPALVEAYVPPARVTEPQAVVSQPRPRYKPESDVDIDWRVIWVVGTVLLMLLRGISSVNSHKSSPVYEPPPKSPSIPPMTMEFTADQIEEFRQYELNQKKGPPPPGYTFFRLAGGKIAPVPLNGRGPGRTFPTNPR